MTYNNCTYNRLPEDKLSVSKRVEDIKKLKIKTLIHEIRISLVYIVQLVFLLKRVELKLCVVVPREETPIEDFQARPSCPPNEQTDRLPEVLVR